MANRGASDQRERGSSSVDWMCSRSTGSRSHTCSKGGSYNGLDLIAHDASRPSDRNPRGAIKCVLQRISTASSERFTRDQTAVICSKRSTIDRFIVTVDHFDRTVMPKYPIKRGVPPICKAFELEINLIDLFRHLLARVPLFHPLLHSFLHP